MVLLHRLADSATVVTGAVVGLVAHAALPVPFERHGWCRSEGEGPGLSTRIVDNAASGRSRLRAWTGARASVPSPNLAQGTVCKILDEEDVTSVVTAPGVEPSTDLRFSMPRKTATEDIA
jgi:hypothetical protein